MILNLIGQPRLLEICEGPVAERSCHCEICQYIATSHEKQCSLGTWLASWKALGSACPVIPEALPYSLLCMFITVA